LGTLFVDLNILRESKHRLPSKYLSLIIGVKSALDAIIMVSLYGCAIYEEYMSILRLNFINLDELSCDKAFVEFLI